MVRKFKIRVPSGRVVIRRKEKKPKVAKCAVCKKPLHGVPRVGASQRRKLSKTQKRPSRAYGGYLCSSCTKEIFREKARVA